MTLRPGQTLAHYRIERLIGQGGMGTVFLAEDTRLHRKVALKVLPTDVARSPARLARFEREARAIAALNHPHIVTIHSVEHDAGIHFLTMELVEGASLDHGLPQGGLPLAKVFDIGMALADALAAAHGKGIVHRDLKPSNVMVTKDGWVKVLDFGLAKRAPQGADGAATDNGSRLSEIPTGTEPRDRTLTEAGSVVGTLPYMSPEQVAGEAVDARSDIFSLGTVLYEMATGRRPFHGKNKAETISSILRDTPSPITAARQDAPRHLARIIDHCLQKEPKDRFQTARDVYNELRALRKEVESVGMPAARRRHPWRWAGLSAVLVLAMVAVFRMIGGGGGPETGAAAMAEANSVAVLPFADLSPGRDQEYFSDGLAEELLNALMKIPGLKVTGRSSSFSFKGKNENLRTIGEKLGVATILEGSVRKSGSKVRITAQLVKASDGFQLWSESYDRTLDDIFAVQGDIAEAVTEALQAEFLRQAPNTGPLPALAPWPRPNLAITPRPSRANIEAWDLVLQARHVLQISTPERVRRAKQILERALALSPEYAPAWAEMGLAYSREQETTTNVDALRKALKGARSAYTRALELDPNLAVALSRLAGVQQADWEFAAADRSTAKAIAAAPSDPIVLGNAAIVYANLGRFDDAIRLAERHVRMDPLTPQSFVNLGNYYGMAGRFDDAEAQFRKALGLRPENPQALFGLATSQLALGRAEEARANFMKGNELAELGDYGRLATEAVVEHASGNEAASRAAVEEFEKRFAAKDPYAAASLRGRRGEVDASFAWLHKSLAARDPLLASIKADANFKSLRADPRWNVILKTIGLPTD